MYIKRGVVIVVAGWLAAGCGQDGTDRDMPEHEPQDTGIALAIDFQDDTDVTGFYFQVQECGGEVVVEETKSIEDLVVPGGIPEFVGRPFDGDSRYLVADSFTTLEPGCYDVEVTPVSADEAPSQDCPTAQATEVFVIDGETTEIVMVSQCDGIKAGNFAFPWRSRSPKSGAIMPQAVCASCS